MMYRVYEEMPKPKMAIEGISTDEEMNCVGWQKLTSSTIPLEDIYHVVYTMPLKDFEKICDNSKQAYDNKFVEWITKNDRAIMDFLLLAKTNEYIRVKRNSRWYYPTMKIDARMTIEQVIEKSLSVSDQRLRERYLLQAVRALFSMQRYRECIDLWDREISLLPTDNLMRKLIQPYIAGAQFRINNTDKAMEYFAQIGDIGSLQYCANRIGKSLSTVDALALVCKYAPNSPSIIKTLQECIRKIEPEGSMMAMEMENNLDQLMPEHKNIAKRLRQLSIDMAQDSKVKDSAMWYYTAAFLSDLLGEVSKASAQLRLAEKLKSSEYITGSIKVFRVYLDAKQSNYDSAYEAKLFKQLKWLDSKIVSNLNSYVCDKTSDGSYLKCGMSYYYWNDMLRRILLAEVCPRMLKAGKTTRALQLANMADNRLINLVNKRNFVKHCIDKDENSYIYKSIEGVSMREFRYADDKYNTHDYSNHFFELIDSLSANSAKRYVQNVRTTKSEFDLYLNARGYTGSDYLNDIVGTKCLREMRYGEAVKYLANVSDAYNRCHLNIIMQYDPLSEQRKSLSPDCDTRYEFACRMYRLEQNIARGTDPNIKAQNMLKYAIGVRNSFDRCWTLTQYYRGTTYWGCVTNEKRDWESDKNATAAIKRAQQYADLACRTATDDEVAAQIQYQLCNFKIVAEKYPNTEMGELVRGKCDKLYDYHAASHRVSMSDIYGEECGDRTF